MEQLDSREDERDIMLQKDAKDEGQTIRPRLRVCTESKKSTSAGFGNDGLPWAPEVYYGR